MIKVSVDEAAAFDMLSILWQKSYTCDHSGLEYKALANTIMDQISIDKFEQVLISKESENLLNANKEVFELIEKITKHETQDDYTDALTVHTANMKRFYAKRELQNKFFNSSLTETKTVE